MKAQETKEAVTQMLAETVQENSLLAPHVAREFAEKAVEKLLAGEYLITGGKIRSVVNTDWEGPDASGTEYVDCTVYTPLEDDD